MSILRICILMVVGLVLSTFSVVATPLPAANWYAVIWARGQDTLYWINRDGIAASLPRPALEQETDDANVRLNISRDGRYLLLAGEPSADNEILSIYDLLEGVFTGTLTAQNDVEIRLGGAFASNKDGTRAAAAFVATDENNESWQVISFDLARGSVLAYLDSSQLTHADGSAPSYAQIRLYQTRAVTEQDIIHFQLWPRTGEIPQTVAAHAWLPDATAATFLQSSPFERASADLNALASEEVFAYQMGEPPLTPFAATESTYNAIGTIAPTAPGAEIEAIYRDQQRFLSRPLWAKCDDWIAVFTESGEQGVTVGWQVLSLTVEQADRQLVALPVNVREVFGTPDGLLAVTTDGQLLHVTTLDDINGTLLYPSAEAAMELIQVVYVSKTADDFALTELAETPAP